MKSLKCFLLFQEVQWFVAGVVCLIRVGRKCHWCCVFSVPATFVVHVVFHVCFFLGRVSFCVSCLFQFQWVGSPSEVGLCSATSCVVGSREVASSFPKGRHLFRRLCSNCAGATLCCNYGKRIQVVEVLVCRLATLLANDIVIRIGGTAAVAAAAPPNFNRKAAAAPQQQPNLKPW